MVFNLWYVLSSIIVFFICNCFVKCLKSFLLNTTVKLVFWLMAFCFGFWRSLFKKKNRETVFNTKLNAEFDGGAIFLIECLLRWFFSDLFYVFLFMLFYGQTYFSSVKNCFFKMPETILWKTQCWIRRRRHVFWFRGSFSNFVGTTFNSN